MLKLGRVTKVKVLFLEMVFVFNFDLFKFSAAILEKGLLPKIFALRFVLFLQHFVFFCVCLMTNYFQWNFRTCL